MNERPNIAHLERRIRGALRQVEDIDSRLRGLLLDFCKEAPEAQRPKTASTDRATRANGPGRDSRAKGGTP